MAPPFSLFPVGSSSHDANTEYDHKRFASSPARQCQWLATVMDTKPSQHKASLAFILDRPPNESSGSDTESDHELTTPLPSVAKRRRVSLTGAQEQPTKPASPDPKKGSKFCIVEGCTSRAKHARKCWRHGGSVKCKVAECINRAKSKGVCWSHGGGTICSYDDCETIAVSHGFCWAHGGGKRCQIEGCSRPAYERTDNYCTTHHKQRVRSAGKRA